MYPCWRIHRRADDRTECRSEEIVAEAIQAPVVVAISHSALNYKDALAITGAGRILRSFPLIPGIDLAGRVLRSADPTWKEGDAVFATGWGLGEERDGGLAGLCGVDASMLMPIPDGFDAERIMALGTAGLTAMQAVRALRHHGLRPDQGPVAVTGASGGVGSLAVALLSRLGFTVHAVSGKAGDDAAEAELRALGASAIVRRSSFIAGAGQALERETLSGGIDCTGGEPLAALLRKTTRYGAVATCGVAAGSDLPVTVFPFILRGVSLLGISSVRYPAETRQKAWAELRELLPPGQPAHCARSIPFQAVPAVAASLIGGSHRGRSVVRILS